MIYRKRPQDQCSQQTYECPYKGLQFPKENNRILNKRLLRLNPNYKKKITKVNVYTLSV